jgi:hypothetical protein
MPLSAAAPAAPVIQGSVCHHVCLPTPTHPAELGTEPPRSWPEKAFRAGCATGRPGPHASAAPSYVTIESDGAHTNAWFAQRQVASIILNRMVERRIRFAPVLPMHAITVNGKWRWTLSPADYAAYKRGKCPSS